MKAIETFNNTNSELKRTINIVFECTLKHIEEASKVGKYIFKKIFKVQKLEMAYAIVLKKKVIFV